MSTQVGKEPGGGEPGEQQRALVRAEVLRRAQFAQILRRKRRQLAPLGAQAAPPIIEAVDKSKVVLQSDFPNVVGSPTTGLTEIEVTRDADGKMRFYGVLVDSSAWVSKLAPLNVGGPIDLQQVLDFLDTG